MSVTFAQARDRICQQVYGPWTTANPTYPIFFEDRPAARPDSSVPWAKVFIRHNQGDQETLPNRVGQSMFFRDGLLTVQVFVPMGSGHHLAYTLAKVVADALEGKSAPGGIWFRRVRIREIGQEGTFFQINVIAEFEYSEAK